MKVGVLAVTLIAAGMLKEYTGGQGRMELAAGPTVREMLEEVGIPPELVAAVVREGRLVPKDYRPQDGDTIKVLAVSGGG